MKIQTEFKKGWIEIIAFLFFLHLPIAGCKGKVNPSDAISRGKEEVVVEPESIVSLLVGCA